MEPSLGIRWASGLDREEEAGHKACDRDGQSDLGLLQSELLLRPFLFLECLSPEVSRSCVGAVAGEEPRAQVSFGAAERSTVEPPGQEGLDVDATWTVALPLPGS